MVDGKEMSVCEHDGGDDGDDDGWFGFFGRFFRLTRVVILVFNIRFNAAVLYNLYTT